MAHRLNRREIAQAIEKINAREEYNREHQEEIAKKKSRELLYRELKEKKKDLSEDKAMTIDRICKQLKEYFAENGMKQTDIAEALDITQAAVSNQLNGRPFGANSAKRWSKTFGFNVTWLTTGEGPMIDKKHPTIVLKGDEDEVLNPRAHIDGELPIIPAWMFRSPNIDIDTMSVDETVETMPAIPVFPEHDAFARCPGDAMFPRILKGQLMAIKKLDIYSKIDDADIYIIDTYSTGMIVRRLRDNKDGTVTCIPSNLDHFEQTTIDKFDIVNLYKVVGVISFHP